MTIEDYRVKLGWSKVHLAREAKILAHSWMPGFTIFSREEMSLS
jgi:hypothetical protein